MIKTGNVKKFALELRIKFSNDLVFDEPLKKHTTYQVGGPATAMCFPKSKEKLREIVISCNDNDIPFFILGGGSNILVHDNGLDQIVIKMNKCCSKIAQMGSQIYAGAGVLVSHLVRFCEEHGLAGLDFMSGIPGTVGGALRMNAGAFTGEIGDRVTEIEAMLKDGQFLSIPVEEAGFGYRKADNLVDKIILGCNLKLIKGNQDVLVESRREYLKERSIKQPLDYGSCGSVFKRPPGDYAGSLIEKAGCKGMKIGGAMVSPRHANFIVNYQNATARDIFQLIKKVQGTVYHKFKIWLELEVKLVGFSLEEENSVKRP